MQIVCPECNFSREVDESKIPPRSQVATCPKCQTKFKFRDLPEQDFLIEESATADAVPEQEVRPESTPETLPGPEAKAESAAMPEAEIEARPETQADSVLKPFSQKDPVKPTSEEPTFPGIPQPDEDAEGGLWDRLHTMTPPETKPDAHREPGPKAERKPPIIGSRYGQPEEDDADRQPVSGWTGEFNSDFPDPMDFEANEDEDGEPEEAGHDMQVPPPFEQLDRYGFFSGLFMTIKLALFSPRLFFSVMPVGNGVSKPLTFAILVALIQTLAQFVWGVAGLTPGMAFTSSGMAIVDYNATNGMFELLLTPAFAAITLYVFTGFYHVILTLLRSGNKGFEGTFRALAYAYAPMITGIIPMPTVSIAMAWMFLYAVWSLVLTAIGFRHIHKSSYLRVIPALLMPLVIGMILALLVMQGQLPTV
ncbi:MAG: zinc-ribbon domain-containing protein [Desulfovibrionaceae bacterium]|nr:zinc-ribbon domain-containing protein [Desulfovibrionaceae bacterium]